MILPIVGLGHSILRQVAKPVEKDYPELKKLVADMYETMYAADGVGLAAPQINLPIRLVVVGFRPYDEKTNTYGEPTEEHTLINPEIVSFGEKKDWFNEGCLSVPDIHEDVLRPTTIRLRWYDEDWNLHDEEIDGLFARVAQHEVDHLEGKVFTDRLSNLRRTMIKRKLNDVVSGRVRTSYRMLKTLILLATVATMAACGPSREERVARIEDFEDSVFESPAALDTNVAKQLSDLYVGFADRYPADSLSPAYLMKAAETEAGILHTEKAIALYDRVMERYPDFGDAPMCLFLKGNAYEQNEQYEEARKTYEEFLEKYPDHYMAPTTRQMLPMIGWSSEEMLDYILSHTSDTLIAGETSKTL